MKKVCLVFPIIIFPFLLFSQEKNYQIIPDTSFGTNGIFYLEEYEQIHDDWYPKIDLDSKGNIYLVGEFYLFKILAQGKYESNFGEKGAVRISNFIWGTNIKVANDDNPIISGYLPSLQYKAEVIKFNNVGNFDTTFGKSGIMMIIDGVYPVDLYKFKKKLFVSYYSSNNHFFALKCFDEVSGLLDSSFGINGTLISTVKSSYYTHTLQVTNNEIYYFGQIWDSQNEVYDFFSIDSLGIVNKHYSKALPNTNDFSPFCSVKLTNGYLIGDGLYNLRVRKVLDSGEPDELYGNSGEKHFNHKYEGWFCDMKKLNNEVNVASGVSFHDSSSSPLLLLFDNEGQLIQSVGDSGFYNIGNYNSYRWEATSIKVLSDSSFIVCGYYQSSSTLYTNDHRYFVGKFLVTSEKATVINDNLIDSKIESFELVGNYPNPFNPSTNLNLKINNPTKLNISIYDILGKQIIEFEESFDIGSKTIPIKMTEFSAGTYFVKISDGKNKSVNSKIVLIK